MAGSGPTGTVEKRLAHDGVGTGELNQLRNLLLGPEWERLTELHERIQNRALRAADVAEVLPEALLLRTHRDQHLRQALQPILEEAIIVSVRKDPRVLAEALFPVIGAAIRRAVASALQSMVESLNQIVETSLTMRSIQWRIEAARTGKAYGEVALLRSLLYRVEQVFLVQRKTGLLLQHVISDATVIRDPEMISGMLTAIQDFVNDSFGSGDETLETMRVGQLSVWVQHGPEAILAGVVRGTPPPQLKTVFSSALEAIQQRFGDQIKSFDGDAASLAPARPTLQTCLLGQSPQRRRNPWTPVYVVLSVVALAIVGWLIVSLREQFRWNSYISTLRLEPGIVITHQEKSGNGYVVSGLRDPLARDPAELLTGRGIPAERVAFHWEPYSSLSPGLAVQREIGQLKHFLDQQIIRFEPGRSDLTDREMDSVESVAAKIKSLIKAAAATGAALRLDAIGHTDELGSEAANSRLGWERANTVKSALAAQDVEPDTISTRSAGETEPLRTGQTERDRSLNRSVSFRVLAPIK